MKIEEERWRETGREREGFKPGEEEEEESILDVEEETTTGGQRVNEQLIMRFLCRLR